MPEFDNRDQTGTPPPNEIFVPARKSRWKWWAALGAAVAAAVAALVLWLLPPGGEQMLKQFWGPLTSGAEPARIYAGLRPAYRIRPDLDARIRLEARGAAVAQSFTPALNPADLQDLQLTLVPDQYVGAGDVSAVAKVAGVLLQSKKTPEMQVTGAVPPDQLKGANAVFVGQFWNSAALQNGGMRFLVEERAGAPAITDKAEPGKSWSVAVGVNNTIATDYAVVTRIRTAEGRMVIGVTGLTQYATLAAADYVTQPASLAELARQAPSNWDQRNLQLLLKVDVANAKASPASLMSVHFW